jgi:hypothetical protein
MLTITMVWSDGVENQVGRESVGQALEFSHSSRCLPFTTFLSPGYDSFWPFTSAAF